MASWNAAQSIEEGRLQKRHEPLEEKGRDGWDSQYIYRLVTLEIPGGSTAISLIDLNCLCASRLTAGHHAC